MFRSRSSDLSKFLYIPHKNTNYTRKYPKYISGGVKFAKVNVGPNIVACDTLGLTPHHVQCVHCQLSGSCSLY